MAVLFANVLITTQRSPYNAVSGATPPAVPWLTTPIGAHAKPVTTSDYRDLPAGALESEFIFEVDFGTDIRSEDIIDKVTLTDGVTPWGQSPTNSNETIWVLLAQDSSAGPLQHRNVYAKRMTGGGPAY